ncbi:MAG: hypothetical protein RL497_1140 [Pseudomonadota bacterium]
MKFFKPHPCTHLSLLILLTVAPHCFSHEDFDLGISQLTFNEACHPVITLKNYGTRALPDTFYQAKNPAFISFKKATLNQGSPLVFNSKPLNSLDKNKKLKQPGGSLSFEVPEEISNNPAPLTAQLMVQGEFWDYGQNNDLIHLAADCTLGKGMIPGSPLPQPPADLGLVSAVAAGNCQVNFKIVNLNRGRIQDSAYDTDPTRALVISAYERRLQKRLPSILLNTLDQTKTLSAGVANLTLKLPKGEYTLSVWQAQGDENFANNHQDVRVSACDE